MRTSTHEEGSASGAAANAAPTPRAPDLAARLALLVGERTIRCIARDTDYPLESVRRQIRDGTPCVRFLQHLCKAYGVSADWLLLGDGPMLDRDVLARTLGRATASELLDRLAARPKRQAPTRHAKQ